MGRGSVNSNQVKKCINDWIASGPNAVQSLILGGTTVMVSLTYDTGTHASCILCCFGNFTRI